MCEHYMYNKIYMYKVCSYMYAGSSENFESSKVAVLVEPGITSSLQVMM